MSNSRCRLLVCAPSTPLPPTDGLARAQPTSKGWLQRNSQDADDEKQRCAQDREPQGRRWLVGS